MTDNPSLGQQIKRARGRLGVRLGRRVSQADLGHMIGASRSAVNSWENDRTYPAEDDLAALEEALGAELGNVSPEPVDPHLRRLIDALTPEEKARVIAHLTGQAPPREPHHGRGEAGRSRRAG